MTRYELRIITTIAGTVKDPDHRECFNAADDNAAIEALEVYAADQHGRAGVFLVPAGTNDVIASRKGRRL